MTNIKVEKRTITENVEPVNDTYSWATEHTIQDMVKSFREFLAKYRNVPQKTNRNYAEFMINATQYVANIMQTTQALLEQNAIQTDKYGFLTKTVTSFNHYNDTINKVIIPSAEELIRKQHEQNLKKKEAEKQQVSVEEQELNPTQVAAIAAEPTEDPATHILVVLTTTKKRWYFDKINFTLSFMKKDGEIKTIKIAKKGSWRATVINFFAKCISWIKEKYNNAKDRCIGIKQTIQFTWLKAKFNAKTKIEAKQKAKEVEQTKAKSDLKEDDSDFKDLPPNIV